MKSLKEQAVGLRRRGWSYNIIAQRLGVGKSTLSHWLRRVPYRPNQAVIARIRAGPARAAAVKQQARLREITRLHADAVKSLGTISRRDLQFLGIGLYMGEGSKLYEMVRVINSDPQIVRLAIEWFRKVCRVPPQNFSIAIHVYPDTSLPRAIGYWSRVTGIPRRQFEKTQVDHRQGKSLKKRHFLPYGTAHIKIRSRGDRRFGVTLHRRIVGWIEAVYDLLKIRAGVAQW